MMMMMMILIRSYNKQYVTASSFDKFPNIKTTNEITMTLFLVSIIIPQFSSRDILSF